MGVVKTKLMPHRLEDFKCFLDTRGIAYRDGKGQNQALQVCMPSGWSVIYKTGTVSDALGPTVREFIRTEAAITRAENDMVCCGCWATGKTKAIILPKKTLFLCDTCRSAV